MLLFHGKPRRQLMPSELCKQLPAPAHFLEHMVILDGTAGALHALFRGGQHEDRPVIPLPDAPRDDPGDAFMAVRQVHHQHPVLFQRRLFNHLHCPLHALLRQFLAAVV